MRELVAHILNAVKILHCEMIACKLMTLVLQKSSRKDCKFYTAYKYHSCKPINHACMNSNLKTANH